jgi:hypothetical protein
MHKKTNLEYKQYSTRQQLKKKYLLQNLFLANANTQSVENNKYVWSVLYVS